MYLNTQMRNRGAVLGPVSFQLDDCKIREIIVLLDKCQEGYLKEASPRTAKKTVGDWPSFACGMESVAQCLAHSDLSTQ